MIGFDMRNIWQNKSLPTMVHSVLSTGPLESKNKKDKINKNETKGKNGNAKEHMYSRTNQKTSTAMGSYKGAAEGAFFL